MRILIIIIFFPLFLFGQQDATEQVTSDPHSIDYRSQTNFPDPFGQMGKYLFVFPDGTVGYESIPSGNNTGNVQDMIIGVQILQDTSLKFIGQSGAFTGILDLEPFFCETCAEDLNLILLDIDSDVDTTGLKELIRNCVPPTTGGGTFNCSDLDGCDMNIFGTVIDTTGWFSAIQNQINATNIFSMDTVGLKPLIRSCIPVFGEFTCDALDACNITLFGDIDTVGLKAFVETCFEAKEKNLYDNVPTVSNDSFPNITTTTQSSGFGHPILAHWSDIVISANLPQYLNNTAAPLANTYFFTPPSNMQTHYGLPILWEIEGVCNFYTEFTSVDPNDPPKPVVSWEINAAHNNMTVNSFCDAKINAAGLIEVEVGTDLTVVGSDAGVAITFILKYAQ